MTQEQKSDIKVIRNEKLGGERPLFATHDLRLENVTITDGESGIKQCRNIEAYDCKFYANILGGMSTAQRLTTAISP